MAGERLRATKANRKLGHFQRVKEAETFRFATFDEDAESGTRAEAMAIVDILLARIFECLPLLCPRCGEPMRIIAFILDPPVIQRILSHHRRTH